MTTTTTNEFQIRQLVQNWANAINAKDIKGICAHHAPDILLFDVPEALQSKGIEAYTDSWENVFFPWYGEDGKFEVGELQVTAGDDVAFCHGIIDCGGTDCGQKVYYKVRLTIGLKKINEQWTIMHEHHSVPA